MPDLDDPLDATTAERLASLTERVERLETALDAALAPLSEAASQQTRDEAASASASDTFWALDRVRALAPESGAVLYTGTVALPSGASAEWQYALTTEAILARDWAAPSAVGAITALASPVRLRILRAIAEGATSVAELTELDGVGTSGQVYHHLNLLVQAGWVSTPTRSHYTIPPERIVPLLTVILATGGS